MVIGFRTPLPDGTRLHNNNFALKTCPGMGGFGITYLAHDTVLDRPVAIKEFFPADCVRNGNRLAPGGRWTVADLNTYKGKFLEEGRILARLHHPGIVQVHTLFEEHGTAYLVMEFVEGQTLGEYQEACGGRLPVPEAVSLIRAAGEALAVVHRAGLLHRDLKPANILRRTNGQVVLIDFGAAKKFLPGDVHSERAVVTRGFAPIEQYKQGSGGDFTDVYALAATLYCLVTGEMPIDSTYRLLGERLVSPQELRSEIAGSVSDAILQGMSLRGQDRPQTVAAFLKLLSAGAGLRVNPIDGAVMVFIPAGDFLMGDNDIKNNPRRNVYLDGYWIYKNVVTVAQYRKFCHATARSMPPAPSWGWKENHPIVNVTWDDAKAYCDWAGVRLPTEAQWEKAARGTDGRKYPWGGPWDPAKCQCSKKQLSDAGGTAPAGGYTGGASPYGVLDMAGNVSQWCSDWYAEDYYKSAPNRNPPGPAPSPEDRRVLRGGSWGYVNPFYFRAAYRDRVVPADRNIYGFRGASGL